tara:strand:+ start:47 stop:298 length:252 start_codon:yes stop_codon:yes gene_type:complete
MDRINIQTLSTIKLDRFDGSDIQVGCNNSGLTLRFGYWQKLSESDVVKVNEILPNHLCLQLNLVDEDEDCGELWNYNIVRKNC